MPLSNKISVITDPADAILEVFPCYAPSLPMPPDERIKVFMFDRPQEAGSPVADDAIKTGYQIQGGALVKV